MPVNVSDPIGQYARFVLRASEQPSKELLNNLASGGTAGTTTSTSAGLAYVPASSDTTWALVEADLDPYVSGDFTVFWYGILTPDLQETLIASLGPVYGWSVKVNTWGPGYSRLILESFWGGATALQLIQSDGTTPIAIAVRYVDSTTTVEMFVNGISIGSGTWTKDPGAIGASQVFSMKGDATNPQKCVTLQAFGRALSNAEIATLASSPFTIFSAPPIDLTASNCSQANSGGAGAIGINGALVADNCAQANASGAGAITRIQDLSISDSVQTNTGGTGSIDPYGRLRGIIAATNTHEWVQVNLNSFLDVTIPTADLPPSPQSLGSNASIVYAWSSFAWDTTNGNLVLWGGGHANYLGDEIYIFNGDTGLWGRGSLPTLVDFSDVEKTLPSKDAPQSSHTYSNNVYLPNNKMFCTFGGAAAASGGPFEELVSSDPYTTRRVGPWCFDLALADPEKVGGANGTGWDVTRLGSNAWYNRVDMIDGTYPIPPVGTMAHIGGAAVVVDEDGTDVAYFTMHTGGAYPYWYRYEFGDIRAGGRDTITKIAETWDGGIFDGFGIWDSTRGMFYRSSSNLTVSDVELVALHVATATGTTHVTPIQLVDALGDPFILNTWLSDAEPPQWKREILYGAVYDPENDRIWMWNGDVDNPGRVYWIAPPAWDVSTGWASTTWTVNELVPTGSSPRGNHVPAGVLGKMRYVPALGAFAVLDSTTIDRTNDPGVWLFKTSSSNALSGSGSTQGNASSTGAITRTQDLAGASSNQANTGSTGAISIDSGLDLAASNAIQANEGTGGEISINGALIAAPSVQDNIAAASAIVQAHMLAASNAAQGNISPARSITLGDALPIRSLVVRKGVFQRTHTAVARFN